MKIIKLELPDECSYEKVLASLEEHRKAIIECLTQERGISFEDNYRSIAKSMGKKLLQDLEHQEWEILRLNTRIALQKKAIRYLWWAFGITFVAWLMMMIKALIL